MRAVGDMNVRASFRPSSAASNFADAAPHLRRGGVRTNEKPNGLQLNIITLTNVVFIDSG